MTNEVQPESAEESYADSGLSFASFVVVVLQAGNDRHDTHSSLNGVDQVLRRTNFCTETIFLYDTVVILLMNMGNNWKQNVTKLIQLLDSNMPWPVNIGVSLPGTSRDELRTRYQQARCALWESNYGAAQTTYRIYEESQKTQSSRVTDMFLTLDRLIDEADLTSEAADRAAETIIQLSGFQYSNLRALVSLYTMMIQKKFPTTDNTQTRAALYETWFVSSGEDVKRSIRHVHQAIFAGIKTNGEVSLLTRKALAYIQMHATEALQLEDVARYFQVSASYLSALMRKETGEAFHVHKQNTRMKIACSMLSDPRIPVGEIALAVGYGSYLSFFNVFKRIQGMTPTEYRNRH